MNRYFKSAAIGFFATAIPLFFLYSVVTIVPWESLQVGITCGYLSCMVACIAVLKSLLPDLLTGSKPWTNAPHRSIAAAAAGAIWSWFILLGTATLSSAGDDWMSRIFLNAKFTEGYNPQAIYKAYDLIPQFQVLGLVKPKCESSMQFALGFALIWLIAIELYDRMKPGWLTTTLVVAVLLVLPGFAAIRLEESEHTMLTSPLLSLTALDWLELTAAFASLLIAIVWSIRAKTPAPKVQVDPKSP
jgi:hypothetical protein